MRNDGRRLPGDGIPQTLFGLIYSVELRIRRHFRGTNLHWGLRRILQQLWLQDGLSQKELSDSVGSSEGSISNMLKHLVAGGWVERRQDDYDYRISRIYLTEKGRAMRDAIVEELAQIDREVREAIGDVSAERLGTLLERTGDALRMSASGTDDDSPDALPDRPSPPGEL